MSTAAGTSTADDNGLFLFDFDGVVCDSCDECTVSALRTCLKLGILKQGTGDGTDDGDVPDYPPDWLFQVMREIRPGIEVGWQIPVLLAVFVEQQQRSKQPGGEAPMSVDEIISNYEYLVSDALSRWELEEKEMIEAFGGVRDNWMGEDLTSWLDINSFYPGVPEALNNCKGEGVLVTTKQQRFAIALMRHAKVSAEAFPDERIYGLGMYKSKADVIANRMATKNCSPEQTRFFEDRWPTLDKCLKDDRLSGVRFYLCKWGYVTSSELALAMAEPRVEVLDLEDFSKIVTS